MCFENLYTCSKCDFTTRNDDPDCSKCGATYCMLAKTVSVCEPDEEEDDECCWTCGKPDPTHKEYRDALGKNEYTCDECHRNEYPEQYEIKKTK